MAHWIQCNFIQTTPTWADASCSIVSAAVGYGPGWNIIFDQDQLAKFEAERANEGERKKTISTLFDRLYGRPVEAPADAPAPAVPRAEPETEIAAELSAREAAYQREKSRELGIQIEMLNALKERAIEVARAKAYRRRLDDDDEELLGLTA